mmetsp:Transcript_30824/g.46704  ORF Transcript_30824/g.46704 Transcript_30824/m.46704 type:complete len:509 (-) Transcript_30824:1003-2529(-)
MINEKKIVTHQNEIGADKIANKHYERQMSSTRNNAEVEHVLIYTPQHRDEEEYAAFVTPERSTIPLPLSLLGSKNSPYSNRKRPLKQPQTSPFMRKNIHVPHTTSSWHQQQQHRHESSSHYDNYCEKEQYFNLPRSSTLCLEHDDIMPFPVTPNRQCRSANSQYSYERINGANPHYSYDFDRHGAFDERPQSSHRCRHYTIYDHHGQGYSPYYGHQNDDKWLQTPSSSVYVSDGGCHHQYPNNVYDDADDDENNAHPLLHNYNPDFDGCCTAHLSCDANTESFDIMAKGTTKLMYMPEAASEVKFDIMKPPMTPVTQPSEEPLRISTDSLNQYDVLLGRGGGSNNHIGNRHFRSLVQDFQPIYLPLRRKDKPLMARSVVLIVRNRGGRFLAKSKTLGEYYEVGDEKAEAKASQALREGMQVRATLKKRKEIYVQQKQKVTEKEPRKRMKYEPSRENEGTLELECRWELEEEGKQPSISAVGRVVSYTPSMDDLGFCPNEDNSISMHCV